MQNTPTVKNNNSTFPRMLIGLLVALLGNAIPLIYEILLRIGYAIFGYHNPIPGGIGRYADLATCVCLGVFFVLLFLSQKEPRLKRAGVAGIVACAACLIGYLIPEKNLFDRVYPLGLFLFYCLLFKMPGLQRLADDMKIAYIAGIAGALIAFLYRWPLMGHIGLGSMTWIVYVIALAGTFCFFALLLWRQLNSIDEDISKII